MPDLASIKVSYRRSRRRRRRRRAFVIDCSSAMIKLQCLRIIGTLKL
jgi:hypothetical protein